MMVLTPHTSQYGKKTIFQFTDQNGNEVFRAVALFPEELEKKIGEAPVYNLTSKKVTLECLKNGSRFSHSSSSIIPAEAIEENNSFAAVVAAKNVLIENGINVQEAILEEEG